MEGGRPVRCVEWFEQWLNSLMSVESPMTSSWNDDLSYYARHQNTFSQNEVAIELYHALHQSDLSLKELSLHIGQIGNLLYQVDTRQLATQPMSRRKQMLTAFFDCMDLSQALPECHRQDSFAYVYLLVRLLYEILLYTKSTSVRTFCYYQIMRNAHVIRVLFGLVTRDVSLKGTEIYVEGETPGCVDALSTVGQLPRRFSFSVMENILQKMLTSKDINLRSCGFDLIRLSPRIVASSPKLLSEIKDALIGPMEETAYKAAIALASILEYVPEDVSTVFLQTSHDHAIGIDFSPQRVQSFCCVAMGCRNQSLYTLVYRMCWNIWIHIDAVRGAQHQLETLIIRESQFYLLLTSTILCAGREELCMRQRKRLESLIYDQRARDSSLEVAFCLNLLYQKHGDIREITRLIKLEVRNIGIVQELNTTLFHLHLKQFRESRHATPFITAIATFDTLLSTDVVNLKLLRDLNDGFKLLRSNHTEHLIRILKIVVTSYENLPYELGYLKTLVFRTLSTSVRMCYIGEFQKFAHFMPEIKDILDGSDLLFLFKPLLSSTHFNTMDDRFHATLANMWVHTLHDLCCIKPPKVHNYVTTPIRLDLLNGRLHVCSESVKAIVMTKKDTFNTDILGGHVRALINSTYERLGNGYAMLQVINLSFRLGFYAEAARCLKELEIWTDHTLLWFNGLYYYALAECETDMFKALEKRVQGLDCLDCYNHQCTLWSLRKTGNDVLVPKLNYTMPPLVTYTWCALKLVFQVAAGHLCKAIEANSTDYLTLGRIFVGLLGHFRVLRWSFKGICNETSDVLRIYEGLCVFLYILCENQQMTVLKPAVERSAESMDNNEPSQVDPDCALKAYILNIFDEDDVHIPQTFVLVGLLAPAARARLYSVSSFLSVCSLLVGGTTKEDSDSSSQSQEMPATTPTRIAGLSLESLFKEFVLYDRVRSYKEKTNGTKIPMESKETQASSTQIEPLLSYLSRDMGELTALGLLVKGCEAPKKASSCRVDLVRRICSIQLPTPIGVLKTFPLPFPALTAVLEYEKRSNVGPVAIHLQGSIRNASRQLYWVKVKLVVEEEGSTNSTIFSRRFRLRQNVLDEYVHVHLSIRQIELCKFSCVVMDSDGTPRGVATHFVPVTQEFNA